MHHFPSGKPHPKRKFTPAEDDQLIQAVFDLGIDDWTTVSTRLVGRNVRQCRERWMNYLSPDVKNDSWTPEEDELLISKHSEIGACWKQIANSFPFRTDINIKNRWHQIQRRQRQRTAERELSNLLIVREEEAKQENQGNQKVGDIFERLWRNVMNDDMEAQFFFGGFD
jgi:hypothetical protein